MTVAWMREIRHVVLMRKIVKIIVLGILDGLVNPGSHSGEVLPGPVLARPSGAARASCGRSRKGLRESKRGPRACRPRQQMG
jgi:hypothetical protein